MANNMWRRFAIVSCVIAISSFIVVIVNLSSMISKRNWIKTEAVVTAIHLPDGVVCGDFTDNNGVKHVEQPLFNDSKFQQIRAVKVVKQETIDKYIGKEITILYNDTDTRIVNYDNLLRKTAVSFIVSLLSLSSFLYCVWHNRKSADKKSSKN